MFLSYYISCYNVPLPITMIKCYCNNISIITTLCSMQMDQIPCLNDATNNDRDIFMAIHVAAAQSTTLNYTYFHVKGHQDKDPEHQLTLAEQYNIDCDQYAKEHVQNSPLCTTTMGNPKFVAAQPHLRIDGKVICCHFLPSLWAAASTPYWTYLQKRLTWTQVDTNLVQWETLSSAHNSFPSQDQCRLILFIHDKLPLHTLKLHPHPGSKLCPSCQHVPEDMWHFLECNHPDRWHFFKKLQKQLTALSIKYALHPSLLTAFWLGLLAIRNDTPYPNIASDLPPELSILMVHQQTCLGWGQLYYGCFTKSWARAIDTLNPELVLSGHQIMTQLLQMVWQYILATWSSCNHHLHQDAVWPVLLTTSKQSAPYMNVDPNYLWLHKQPYSKHPSSGC